MPRILFFAIAFRWRRRFDAASAIFAGAIIFRFFDFRCYALFAPFAADVISLPPLSPRHAEPGRQPRFSPPLPLLFRHAAGFSLLFTPFSMLPLLPDFCG